jgi:hypothetical protein
MNSSVRRLLLWSPRILGILFAGFVSLFALDVFGEGYSFGEAMVALLIHLIPTYMIIIALAIAWRWDWLGGFLFVGLGLLYIILFQGRVGSMAYLIISGPPILVGLLFLVGWRYRSALQTGS